MKKIISLFCLLCMVLCFAPSAMAAEENASEEIVLMDNDYGTVTLLGTIEEDYYVGYQVLFENKTSDQYLWLTVEKGSVDGMMEYIDAQNSMVSPGMKTKAELRIYTDDSDVKTVDDLINVKGSFTLYSNSDGGSSYNILLEGVKFEILSDDQNQNSDNKSEEEKKPVLMDNEYGIVTLQDTVEEDYYVGYKVLFENKTADQYLWLTVENGSVDGMMEYIDAQNSMVSPGMKTKAELRIYTDDSDVKTVDDLINVKGSFTLYGNSDGGSSYNIVLENVEFEIPDEDDMQEPISSEEESNTEKAASQESSTEDAVSEEMIDELLQGTWLVPTGTTGKLSFDNGVITVTTQNPADSTKEITVGETVTTDSWQLTFTKQEFTTAIYPADLSGRYYYMEADPGYTFYNIEFDVKNLDTAVQAFSSAISNVVIHCGKYSYDNYEIYYDNGGNDLYSAGKGTTLGSNPLGTTHLYVGTSIPDEALQMGGFSAELVLAGEKYVIVSEKLSVKIGDSGDTVMKVQTRLTEKGYLSGTPDGSFGAMTESAVITFQQDNGLAATGVVDKTTYNMLFPEENQSNDKVEISGSYKIDLKNSKITAELIATDGTPTLSIPFTYEDGELVIYNNAGDACIKES